MAVRGRTPADQAVQKGERRLATWTAVAVAGLTLVALGLRLYRLDWRSLWLDEILTSQPAHLGGPGDVIFWSQAAINQMPLFYMFTWFFGHWGDSGVILRLPPVIFGTLLVPALYLLTRDVFGVRAGIVAGLLAAVLPFAVWYSQEARNYSLLMLMTTLQMWFAYRSVKSGRVFGWLGLALFTILNVYTHYVALAATAAVAVYVLVFVLADALRGAPVRVKVAVGGLVALAAAAAALIHWRPLLKAAWDYALAHARGHRALVIGIALVVAVIAIVLATALWRRSPRLRQLVGARRYRQLELAALTGAVVALAYLPWAHSLLVFLGRPDQSLGQIHVDHPPGLPELASLLGGLNLGGVLLIALCGGLVALGVWTFKGKAAESLLVLLWLAVPLALFGYSAGRNLLAIDTRYLAFLVPAALTVIGVAVEALALGTERLAARMRRPNLSPPRVGAISAVVVVALLLVQTLPALASSYGVPKNDYRTTAERVAAASPPGSIVISVGDYSDWTVICLKYYFRQLHSDVQVVDGPLIGRPVADALRSGHGSLSPLLTQQTGRAFLKGTRIRELLNNKQYDVIHYHNISLLGPEVLTLKPAVGRFVKLYTTHEHWLVCPMHVLWKFGRRPCEKPECFKCMLLGKRPPQLWRQTDMLARASRHVDQFVSPSRFTARMHAERGFPEPVIPLPYFIDHTDADWQSPARPVQEQPYFLFVGRLEHIKGLHTLIDTWARVPEYDLLVAGAGNEETALRARAAANPRIKFLGPQRQHELAGLYVHARACIVPSITYETFGIIIIEAFARKTPVIVRDLGALTEVVRDSGGGYAYRTEAELLVAIRQLGTDARQRVELGERGYQAFVRWWSREAHLARYFGLLDTIALRKFGTIPWQMNVTS